MAAERAGLAPMVTNPFRSIVVRAVEVVHAAATIIDLLDRYVPPDPPYADGPLSATAGQEAGARRLRGSRRGLLYHRYQEINDEEEGLIRDGHGDRARRPRRTSSESKRTCFAGLAPRSVDQEAARWRSPAGSSRQSATTTPVSPAPPTSWTCDWSADETSCDRRGQPGPW